MTITSLYAPGRLWLPLVVALVLSPALALAQNPPYQAKPASSSAAASNAAALQAAQRNQQTLQAQQNAQQAHVLNQLQKNQVQEQQRQTQATMVARPFANDPATTNAMNMANQAQNSGYNARQQAVVDRYRSAVGPTPPTVLPTQQPAGKSKPATQQAPQQPTPQK